MPKRVRRVSHSCHTTFAKLRPHRQRGWALGHSFMAPASGFRVPLVLACLIGAPFAEAAPGPWPPPAAPSAAIAVATCPPASIETTPLPAGLMRVTIASPCRKQEKVRMLYAGIEWVYAIGGDGVLTAQIDCVVGEDFPLDIVFADGSRVSLKVQALDLARVTKIAVLWRAPVNLDLHAFEYAAKPGSPGHVWTGATPSAEEAEATTRGTKRGRGVITTASNGTEAGTKLEVYTFWRSPEQKSGVVAMALDYESRARQPQDPDTCGTGLYSEIRYETIQFDRGLSIKRQIGSLAPVDCNVELSGQARYNTKTIPEIAAKP